MLGKSKVLDYKNEWYDEIDASSYYEKNLENTILSKLNSVYPNYIGVPFSLPISNAEDESSTPDFVLIRKDYQEWYVIEVEMSRHSWDDHVEKQVRVFSSGIYKKDRVAQYIKEKNSSLDTDKLVFMVDNFPPKVMVIVNEAMPEWEKKVRKYQAFISVFQIYKGTNGIDIYRVEGHTPHIVKNRSHCAFLRGSANILEVFAPNFIEESHDIILEIVYKGKKTRWKKVIEEDRIFLVVVGHNMLPIENRYVLIQSESSEYYLEIN